MTARTAMQLERKFLALPRGEREAIIAHGAAIRLSDLRRRLFLAESKVKSFEETYATTLEELENNGLPDDAGYAMHEDYVMWHHWSAVIVRLNKDIAALEEIAVQGLTAGEVEDEYKAFRSAFAGWADVDTDSLKQAIYESRKSSRPPVDL